MQAILLSILFVILFAVIALAVPTAVYFLLGMFGIHLAFWKIVIATYLLTFILHAIFPSLRAN